MIEVLSLTKRYGSTVAVDRISFSVGEGRIAGFVGPNGAGKTTTLRILACFMPPTSGSATVAGRDVVRESLEVRRRIGYMPENVPFYGEMRVGEYLHYRAKLKDVPTSERRRRVAEVMERCAIREVSGRLVGELSKGYRQRLGLADCLVHEPKIFILDEPTVGLDPSQIRETRKLLKELAERRTVLLSTHILPEVEMICDDVILIHGGRIVVSDSLGRLLSGDGKVRLRLTVKGDVNAAERAVRAVAGVSAVERTSRGPEAAFRVEGAGEGLRERVSRAVTGSAAVIADLYEERRTLEDVFVETVGGKATGESEAEG
ncbi:MAG: ABC transporter ATP-binding protein [Planctomycetota bacterium]